MSLFREVFECNAAHLCSVKSVYWYALNPFGLGFVFRLQRKQWMYEKEGQGFLDWLNGIEGFWEEREMVVWLFRR